MHWHAGCFLNHVRARKQSVIQDLPESLSDAFLSPSRQEVKSSLQSASSEQLPVRPESGTETECGDGEVSQLLRLFKVVYGEELDTGSMFTSLELLRSGAEEYDSLHEALSPGEDDPSGRLRLAAGAILVMPRRVCPVKRPASSPRRQVPSTATRPGRNSPKAFSKSFRTAALLRGRP